MSNLILRKANENDIKIYFQWANDSTVRINSFNSTNISWEEHSNWFNQKINDPDCCFYIFEDTHNNFIGQVRFQRIDTSNYQVGISIGSEVRGKGYGAKILLMACNELISHNSSIIINAYIKTDNLSSKLIFEKAGFVFRRELVINNHKSLHYIYYEDK